MMDLMGFFMWSVILLLAVGSNLVAAKHRRRDARRDAKIKRLLDEHYNKSIAGLIKSETGYPNRRRTQLYSRNTGHFIQVLPRRNEKYGNVVAKGTDGDIYAELEILTVSFGKVHIRGLETGLYICFDTRGRLKGKKRPCKKGKHPCRKGKRRCKKEKRPCKKESKCIFGESHDSDAYSLYESQEFNGTFLAFSIKGIHSHKAENKKGTEAAQFVERSRSEVIPKKRRYYTSNDIKEPIKQSEFDEHKARALKMSRLSSQSNPRLNPIRDRQSTKKHRKNKNKKKKQNSKKNNGGNMGDKKLEETRGNSRFPPKGRLGNEEKDWE